MKKHPLAVWRETQKPKVTRIALVEKIRSKLKGEDAELSLQTIYRWEKLWVMPQKKYRKPIKQITGLEAAEFLS